MGDIDPIASPEYAYVQVANILAGRIAAGQIAYALPGERDLARDFGVAYQTVRRGIALLRTRGLVITRHGRGTFVVRRAGSAAGQGTPPGSQQAAASG